MIVLIATGFGLLLALAGALVLIARERRPAMVQSRRFEADGQHLPAGRDAFRVYGERIRVAFAARGADLLILGLGLAAAVALGALVAS